MDHEKIMARIRHEFVLSKAARQEKYAAPQRTHRKAMLWEPPKSVTEAVFRRNWLTCFHHKFAWEACGKCRRTKENALAQTVKIRAKLGV